MAWEPIDSILHDKPPFYYFDHNSKSDSHLPDDKWMQTMKNSLFAFTRLQYANSYQSLSKYNSGVCHIYSTYIFVNVWRQKDFHQYLSKEKVLFLIIWWAALFGRSLLLKGAKNAIENRKDFLEAL